jgi:hypothetical protein
VKIIGCIEWNKRTGHFRFTCRRAPLPRYRAPWRKNYGEAQADGKEFVRNSVRVLSLLIERFAVELLEDELARAEEAVTE